MVEACGHVSELYRTERLAELTMELYAHIFKFFRDVMQWYLSKVHKRLIKSFNEDLFDVFEAQIDSIRDIARHIKEVGQLGQAGEVRIVRYGIEDIRAGVEELTRSFEDAQRASMQREEERLRLPDVVQARQDEMMVKISGLIRAALEEQASKACGTAPPIGQVFRSRSVQGLREVAGAQQESKCRMINPRGINLTRCSS